MEYFRSKNDKIPGVFLNWAFIYFFFSASMKPVGLSNDFLHHVRRLNPSTPVEGHTVILELSGLAEEYLINASL